MSKIFMPRKIGLTGNSLYVTIPQDVIRMCNLSKGQEIAFIIDGDNVIVDLKYSTTVVDNKEVR